MHSYLESALKQIEGTGGDVGWMYLDEAGQVRVGAGLAVADEYAARKLPFQLGVRAATEREIVQEYRRVAAMSSGNQAASYRRVNAPELECEVLHALLRTTLVGLQVKLREEVADFDRLPPEVKAVALQLRFLAADATAMESFLQNVDARHRARKVGHEGQTSWHLPRFCYGLLGAGNALVQWLAGVG